MSDQARTLRVDGDREEVCISEALPDLGGLARGRRGSLQVPVGLVLKHGRQHQITALDTVALLPLEQPVRACEPAGGGTHFASEREVHADPERAPHGAQRLARVLVQVMGTL
jgi:hypothetical protein